MIGWGGAIKRTQAEGFCEYFTFVFPASPFYPFCFIVIWENFKNNKLIQVHCKTNEQNKNI